MRLQQPVLRICETAFLLIAEQISQPIHMTISNAELVTSFAQGVQLEVLSDNGVPAKKL